jgi:ribulose-phosphate 3-epimerase
VNPGFPAQRFIPNSLRKVRTLAQLRRERGLQFAIEIDGGVSLDNVAEVVRAGCDWIVIGSAIYDSADPATAVARLQQAAREATMVHV